MTSSLFRLVLAGLVSFALTAAPASALENIVRKKDKPVTGDVTAVSKTEVTVKVRTPREDTLKIPANDIQSISWTGEPPDANIARSDDTAGRYQRAIDGYQKAIQNNKASNPAAKTDLEYGLARATARLALTDPVRLDDAIKRLDEFRSKQSDHYRYYEAVGLLGQLYLAKKDFVKAQSSFDTLAKAPWKEAQLAAKTATGRMLLADGKPDEAVAAFDSVIAQSAEGRSEEMQRQEALLGKSQVLISQKKFDEAQKLLEEFVKAADKASEAEDAKVMAEAYVRLGDCFREQGKDKEALFAYLYVDVLFPVEKPLHAEALFRITRLFEKIGDKGRAAEIRDKLEGDEFKNTEWAQQLKTPAAG